jgi:hypothetical protein
MQHSKIDFEPLALTPEGASERAQAKFGQQVSVGTLRKYRSVGGGPPYRKVSPREVVYPVGEFDAWCESRMGPLVGSATEERAAGGYVAFDQQKPARGTSGESI